MRGVLVIVASALLSGCVGSSGGHVNCQHINWRRLGYQDGTHGNYRQHLVAAFPTCGSNIIVNRSQYQVGWRMGVESYCLPENGARLGMEGKMYNNVCSPKQIASFDKAWRQGIKKFCIPHNGYNLGLAGKSFPEFCPSNVKPAFHRAYRRGAEHYQQLSVVKNQLDNVKNQISQISQARKRTTQHLRAMKALYSQQSFSPQKQYEIQQVKIQVKRLTRQETNLIAKEKKLSTRYTSLKRTFLKMN